MTISVKAIYFFQALYLFCPIKVADRISNEVLLIAQLQCNYQSEKIFIIPSSLVKSRMFCRVLTPNQKLIVRCKAKHSNLKSLSCTTVNIVSYIDPYIFLTNFKLFYNFCLWRTLRFSLLNHC